MLRFGFIASVLSFSALVACSSSSSTGNGFAPSGAADTNEPGTSTTTAGKDAGASSVPVKGSTCGASKECGAGATCVTGGGDDGFCALACDPSVGCAGNLRCAYVASAGAAYCLETCADDGDCAEGFVCARSVGAVLGKYACVRSCEGIDGYCGEGRTCGENGLCPERLVCDDAKRDASGIDGDRTLGSLTNAERGKMCDFTACGWGGYGATKKCPDGFSMSAPDSKAECTAESTWSKCSTVTVGEYEACEKKMRVDQCKAFEILTTDPDCASALACAK
jgi:hypothetical protein